MAVAVALAPAPATASTGRPSDAPVLPAELVALEAATRAAMAAARAADGWDAATRAAVLAWVGKHRDQVALLEARVLTAERAAGTWSLQGDRDLAGFVGRRSRLGRGAGLAAVAQAATLEAMPVVAGALVDGPVTTTHLAQIARATGESPALAARLATPQGQAQVVELAGRLDGAEFGKVLRQQAASLDPAMVQRSHDEQRARRSLAWTHTPSGTLVKGLLDSVAGDKFAKMIDAYTPRPMADDERSREMRQADALMVAVDRMLAEKDATTGMVAPVQALVTMTEETWAALRTASVGNGSAGSNDDGSASPAGSTDRVVTALRGVPAVVDERGQAWPASEIARALCDCALTRAVVGAAGEPLDLGRERRLFNRNHWLALFAAGIRGCGIAGCGMPLAFTELHHTRWWHDHAGKTDIANCIPYCSYHHHEVHRWGLAATRLPGGGYEHHHPDGRLYGGAPPGGGQVSGGQVSGEQVGGEQVGGAPPGGGEVGEAEAPNAESGYRCAAHAPDDTAGGVATPEGELALFGG